MDILIIANYCMDFSKNDNGRFSYLANKLSKNNNVEIVTSDFYHITKKKRNIKNIEKLNYKVTFLYEPGYKKNICLKRFYSHWVWGRKVKAYLNARKKPDVIYVAVPSLDAPYYASRYAKKNNIRFIIDIQDLWPESFKIALDIPIISDILSIPFKYRVNRIYKNADEICAVSETYLERALSVNDKCSKGCAVYLGTDISKFDKNKLLKNDIKAEKNSLLLGYAGTLGNSYDLNCVFDALRMIDSPITFIIMGDGPQKEAFEKAAKGLDVIFTGRLPYEQMCSILSSCDMVVNPIVGKSVATIINKHSDYAACGLPVLNTQNSKEYIDLVNKYHMGYNIKPGDSKDLAYKISLLIENEQTRAQMGRNARKCGEEKFDREYTYKKLIDLIEKRES